MLYLTVYTIYHLYYIIQIGKVKVGKVVKKIKTTEWKVSTQSHVVTMQALGENIQYRKISLEKVSR